MSRSSRQKRNSQQYAVSLFPFLAVLVCTLGVLIVMLVVAVQEADVEGRQQRDKIASQQRQQLEDAQQRRELAEFESQSILSVRGALTARLRDAKGDRSYLQQQIKDTDRQAEDVFKAISNLTAMIESNQAKANDAEYQSEIAETLKRLRREVATAQKTLKQLREDKSFETKSEYVIIPFTGSGGTHRQPIFVECVRDGIVLQPYNIKLNRAEFTLPLSIGNMLDSALLTVREYWERHGLADADSKPYPLLVVRPDGAESYGMARRAMKSWDDEFGYELVESDLQLRFGQPDLKLKSEIEAAVEMAKKRQRKMARQRRLDQDDPWKSNLQLSRGLKPSASGGFEFAATGRPAHELFDQENRNGRSSEPFSNASYGKAKRERKQRTRRLQPTDPAGDSSADSSADGNPSVEPASQQSGASAGSSASSLANSRGSNWALPAKTTSARAYVRPIRLICDEDKISIISQNVVTATVPLRTQTVASIDPLVSEVWKTIESWGLAGRGAYWKPELRFSVVPGAELRFEELRVLLDDSGLLVESANEG